jgi:hypothetical protein
MGISRRLAQPLALTALFAVTACERGDDQMEWARAALERNGQIEIVATDEGARTFTVRDKATGTLRMVSVDEIAAAPAGEALATSPALAAATSNDADVPTGAASSADASAAVTGDENASATNAPREPTATAEPAAEAQPVEASAGERIIASGPGYSIKAAGSAPAASAPAAPTAETNVAAAAERRHEPLVCQGARFLRIDGRTIAFEGDGVRAEDGCEIHITNSRITASGVGVAARAANVHITNSTVTGQSGSVLATDNAQVYAQSSRFDGAVRRLAGAVIHDSGNNVWQ